MMSFSIKQSALTMGVSNSVVHKRSSIRSSFSPCLNLQNNNTNNTTLISVSRPLHISSIESCFLREERPVILCKAYEANKSSSSSEAKSETAQRVKIVIFLQLAPKIDLEFWKALFPVAVAHTIGHVAALQLCMSKVAVSFTHIIKAANLLLLSSFRVLARRYLPSGSLPVPSSNHRWLCSRRLNRTQLQHDRRVAAHSIFYHLYNQVSYMSLDEISPLTFSIGNTLKRISVIVSSIIIFHTPIQPINALGAAIAILGTFLYSQVSDWCNLTSTTHQFMLLTEMSLLQAKA
ncbi:hypothetical protein F3Y22_tig00111445pilonHSYRG00051 [Hibiscus syriacus]|uniref:Sugar phosphate transporter domain-containing protein n=1 Tax=Hibiscus syriacus TaxID=106335 RepID=A0A6A2Y341_HIBSY|nr:hypothetical protein F3Y22_tig00111445pilonHSYRG00051 [Hibiscus syriacus]